MRNPRTLDSHNPPTTHSSIEPLVTLAEVAEILGCSPQTIKKRRVVGGHPLFDKGFLPLGVGGGLRFLASDVREFIDNVATDAASRHARSSTKVSADG